VEVSRRYRFSAAHRLRRAGLTPEENARLYGRCSHPSGHGHTYQLSVTLRGAVEPESGTLAGMAGLDGLVAERLLARLDQENLDQVITPADGPTSTTEALLRLCWRVLADALPPGQLRRLRVEETANNFFELEADGCSGPADERSGGRRVEHSGDRPEASPGGTLPGGHRQ
jgi:6-pyruvoyltetrahydropterin/6-carboxytetrahydropterin synthase